jgi:hypothetical protein
MNVAREIRRVALAAVLAGGSLIGGCHRHVASAADCRAVLDRLVELELKESGYRDPALAPRWQQELARRFAADLRHCQALRVRDDLPGCLRVAENPEEIAHRCLK